FHITCTCISEALAPTMTHSLSLHDALPISRSRRRPRARGGAPARSRARLAHGARPREGGRAHRRGGPALGGARARAPRRRLRRRDRKSTRLNSSHVKISYAVFCLKEKTSSY